MAVGNHWQPQTVPMWTTTRLIRINAFFNVLMHAQGRGLDFFLKKSKNSTNNHRNPEKRAHSLCVHTHIHICQSTPSFEPHAEEGLGSEWGAVRSPGHLGNSKRWKTERHGGLRLDEVPVAHDMTGFW